MKLLRYLFIIISFALCIQQAFGQAPQQFDLSGLAPEERELMEMFQNMTAEEQQEMFMGIMEELEKEVNKMPPEEQEKFLENFWAEVEREATQLEAKIKPLPEQIQPEQEPTPIAPTPTREEKTAPVQPIVTSKIDDALKIIDSLLSKLENIVRKSSLIPDFSIKVETWVKKGEVKPSFDSWETLKNKIELLVQQLHKLQERDLKTKEYKYLVELIKNEVVFNNLSRVESVLRTNVPHIEVPEFESTQLKEKSVTALKNSLTSISEAFYKLGIPASLDCIIEKYEPTAKKLKEEQEACIREAQQSRGMVKVTPPIEAGRKPEAPKYQPMPKQPTYAPPSYYEPSFPSAPFETKPTPTTGGRGGGGIGAAPSKGGEAPGAVMPEKPMGAGGGAGKPAGLGEGKKEEKKSPEKPEEKKKTEEDKRIEKAFDTLQSAVEKVTDSIIDHGFKNIQAQVLGAASVNIPMAQSLQQVINTVDRAIGRADAVHSRFNNLTPEQKKYYSTTIKEIIETTRILDTVISQIDAIKREESNISNDKKYAFLGGKQIPETAILTQSIPIPASLYDLQKSLKDLMNRLRSIK